MIDNIQEYMSDNEQSFRSVLTACDDLIGSKYILAEAKISVLLQKIAYSRKAYELFESALRGFDFGFEFTLAKRRTSLGTDTLVLPTNPRRVAALVFCILLDIDTGVCVLKDFLRLYYYSDNLGDGFSEFIKSMIIPFRAAVEELSTKENVDESMEEEEGISSEQWGESADLDTIFADLSGISARLNECELLDDKDFEEANFTLNELSCALSSADRNGIRMAYLALRRTVDGLPQLSYLTEELSDFGDKLVRLGAIPFA